MSDAGDTLIKAYCHERRALRSFKASRIEVLVDISTGEVLEDEAEIQEALFKLAEHGPFAAESNARALLRSCRPGANILLFLSRCDGEQHASETQVILNYLDYAAETPDTDWSAMEKALNRLYVDELIFERSLQQLIDRDSEELVRVGRFAARLIAADGTVSQAEALFGQELANALESLC